MEEITTEGVSVLVLYALAAQVNGHLSQYDLNMA